MIIDSIILKKNRKNKKNYFFSKIKSKCSKSLNNDLSLKKKFNKSSKRKNSQNFKSIHKIITIKNTKLKNLDKIENLLKKILNDLKKNKGLQINNNIKKYIKEIDTLRVKSELSKINNVNYVNNFRKKNLSELFKEKLLICKKKNLFSKKINKRQSEPKLSFNLQPKTHKKKFSKIFLKKDMLNLNKVIYHKKSKSHYLSNFLKNNFGVKNKITQIFDNSKNKNENLNNLSFVINKKNNLIKKKYCEIGVQKEKEKFDKNKFLTINKKFILLEMKKKKNNFSIKKMDKFFAKNNFSLNELDFELQKLLKIHNEYYQKQIIYENIKEFINENIVNFDFKEFTEKAYKILFLKFLDNNSEFDFSDCEKSYKKISTIEKKRLIKEKIYGKKEKDLSVKKENQKMNLNLNCLNKKEKNLLLTPKGFHQEFLALADQFSLSWREKLKKRIV